MPGWLKHIAQLIRLNDQPLYRCHKNAGFSLVESIVGILIISLLIWAMASALSNTHKFQKNSLQDLEFRELSGFINNYLQDKSQCPKLFKSITIKKSDVFPKQLNLLQFNGMEILKLGKSKGGVTPTNIEFRNLRKSFSSNADQSFYFLLEFSFSVEKDHSNGSILTKGYDIYFRATSTGEIIGCGLLDSSEESLCIQSERSFDFSKYPFCQ